jgi:diaminopimelate decarboxylase
LIVYPTWKNSERSLDIVIRSVCGCGLILWPGGNLKISTGHGDSKFGVPLEQVDKVLQVVKDTNLFIRGLHIHTGSEIKDVEVFAKGIEVLFEVAQKFNELEFLDLGGGFKVPYEPGEEGTDIERLGKKVAEEFEWFEKKYNRHLQVWFEPWKIFSERGGLFYYQSKCDQGIQQHHLCRR